MIDKRIIHIDGVETNYYVTIDGKVFNRTTGHELTPKVTEDGYLQIKLFVDGKRVYKMAHDLVAMEYIPNPNNYPQVNHKDGVHTHNHASNLEWCTAKYNVQHSVFHRLRKNIKLSNEELFRLCILMESGEYTQNQLAAMFDVPRHIITSIKNKQSWVSYSDMFNVGNCKVEWNLTPDEKVVAICEMIMENELMLDEIAELVGVSHGVVCDIYHKKNFKSIVNRYDFSNYTKYQRYDKEYLKKIQDLIMENKTNKEIREILNLENNSKNNKLIYRQRKKIGQKQ